MGRLVRDQAGQAGGVCGVGKSVAPGRGFVPWFSCNLPVAGKEGEAVQKRMTPITLKLFADLSRFLPKSSEAFPVEEGTTIRDLIAGLNIPGDQARLIFVNGRKEGLDYVLNPGDRVGIFPPVGGG
jgi:molybdopterin converting factor small subunit